MWIEVDLRVDESARELLDAVGRAPLRQLVGVLLRLVIGQARRCGCRGGHRHRRGQGRGADRFGLRAHDGCNRSSFTHWEAEDGA